jgi:hypothetical protein
MTPPMVLMLILSFLMLVTSFVVSFREPTERLVHVGLTTLLLIYFAVSTMWPVVFEGDRVIANPLPRVVTASLFSGSLAAAVHQAVESATAADVITAERRTKEKRR